MITTSSQRTMKNTISRSSDRKGEPQNHIFQETIKNEGTSLNVTIYHHPGAETIILLHGGPGVPNAMKEVVQLLNEKYQVVYFEQRGTGKSRCLDSSYKMEDYISDINAIAAHLQLEQFHLLGHSWGGLYAQIYADTHPEKIRGLFLCSPGSGTNNTWKKTEQEVLQFNKKTTSTREWLAMGWYSMMGLLGQDRAYQQLFKQVYKNYHKDLIPFQMDIEELQSIKAEPINKTRKEIINYKSLPVSKNPAYSVAITYGDQDIYGDSKQEVLDRYPTAEVYTIKKSGHIPWLHHPQEFNQVLLHFFGI